MPRKDGTPRASTTGTRSEKPPSEDGLYAQFKKSRDVKFNDELKEIFLLKLLETGQKILACKAAGVAWLTYDRHCKDDEAFAAAVDEVIRQRSKTIVDELEASARKGHVKVTKDKDGNIVCEQIIYETQLRAMLLKRHEEEYKDKTDLNITGGGGGVLVVPAGMTMDEYITKAKEHRETMLKDQAARDTQA